ncbi:MAG: hypothetical protein ACI9KE_005076 [Polyangiales bacterium]|jgi:hypothetical protein
MELRSRAKQMGAVGYGAEPEQATSRYQTTMRIG